MRQSWGIAIELIEYLVSTVNCNIIIISRKTQNAIELGLKKIQNKTCALKFIQADLTDYEAISQVIDKLDKDSISIDGVINTAGNFLAQTICETSTEDWSRVLSPKVQGSIVLYHSIKRLNPKFCYVFSSSTTIDYTIGTCGYFTANLFLDYYNKQHSLSSGIRNIKWGMWRDVGMSDPETLAHPSEEFYRFRSDYAFSPDQGREVFQRSLACYCPELLITLEPVEEEIVLPEGKKIEIMALGQEKSQPRRLSKPADSEIEILKKIWYDALHVSDIGQDDSFFELGGHSLMATQLINKINKAFGSQLMLRDLFQNPTINSLAKLLS